jgi:hypothetical protein
MLRRPKLAIVVVTFVALTIVVVVDAYARSHRPPPGVGKSGQPEQNQTQGAQQPPAPDQRGTENAPFIVKAQPSPKTQAQTDQEAKDRLDQAAYNWDTLFLSGLLIIVAFLQFVAIGIQAVFLWLAFKATKKSADIAEAALVQLNRAFISPKGLTCLSHRNEDIKGAEKYWYSIVPIWENSGNTPTRDMTIYVNSYFESTPMPSDFRFPPFISSEKIPIFAGPKATFGGSWVTKTGDELAKVKAGTKYFYIWGEARYRDIFATIPDHITRFAYQITVLGNPADPPGPGNVIQLNTSALPRHNCADEECERDY